MEARVECAETTGNSVIDHLQWKLCRCRTWCRSSSLLTHCPGRASVVAQANAKEANLSVVTPRRC